MAKTSNGNYKCASSWNVADMDGLECFRAHNMIHNFRRHSHEGYTIGVIEDGSGDNNYRGSVFHLSPGKIVVMNPDEVHTGCVISKRPWSYRMFYIGQELFREMLPEKSKPPFFQGLCFENEYWFNKLLALHRLLESRAEDLARQNVLFQVMAEFARSQGKAPDPGDAGREPKAVNLVKEFIDANCQRNISINELAKITQLHRAYLIRSFRDWVGIPPHVYLMQTRIKHAKRLLAQKVPVAQVAYEMGFSDQSHLTRQFKSFTGITPRQYAIGRCYS